MGLAHFAEDTVYFNLEYNVEDVQPLLIWNAQHSAIAAWKFSISYLDSPELILTVILKKVLKLSIIKFWCDIY